MSQSQTLPQSLPQALPRHRIDDLGLDTLLLFAALGLVALGLVMVTSATIHKVPGSPFSFMNRHLMALVLGFFLAFVALRIPMQLWEGSGAWLYFLGLGLLILVMVPGLGKEVNGAVRWIPLGPFNFQSSEFMKLFMIFYVAGYIVRRQQEVTQHFWGFLKPLLLVSLACAIIVRQPDLGTAVVIMTTVLGLMFLGGVPLWQFGILMGLFVALVLMLIIFEPYRLARAVSFLNPWDDPLKTGFQLTQALIAFGRGEWSGVGLGAGIQKLFYLPEAHTDFILSVMAEELGLLGTLGVMALFGVLVWRSFAIGMEAERLGLRFNAFAAYGFGLLNFLQASFNVGVNTGLLPTKGLTLPFISYGSNSVMVACMVCGILLRIDHENRLKVREGQAWPRS